MLKWHQSTCLLYATHSLAHSHTVNTGTHTHTFKIKFLRVSFINCCSAHHFMLFLLFVCFCCLLNRAISVVQVNCTVDVCTIYFFFCRLFSMFIGMFLSCIEISNCCFRQESYRIETCIVHFNVHLFFIPFKFQPIKRKNIYSPMLLHDNRNTTIIVFGSVRFGSVNR